MKLNIRKGLFETSSSSEDSLSVYQSMELFILPKKEYKKFINGELYVNFSDMKPSFTDDEEAMLTANEKFIKERGINRDLKSLEQLGAYLIYNHRSELYINYNIYLRMVNGHFSDANYFEYENGDEVIFGYYGYMLD